MHTHPRKIARIGIKMLRWGLKNQKKEKRRNWLSV